MMGFEIFTGKGKWFNKKTNLRKEAFVSLRKDGWTYQKIADVFDIKHRQQIQEAVNKKVRDQ